MQVKVVNDSLCPPFPPKPAAVGLIVVQRLIAVFRSANRVEHLILRQQQQTGCRSSRMRNTDSFCVADFWPFGCYRPLLFWVWACGGGGGGKLFISLPASPWNFPCVTINRNTAYRGGLILNPNRLSQAKIIDSCFPLMNYNLLQLCVGTDELESPFM